MKNQDLYQDSHEATYCPQDNKLRLYVGRVDREEYLALKKEGWTSTPKQDCDFAATWTPEREDTAISYADYVGDEDQSPQDRAVDRAERFAGYRDKRTSEALQHADNYDNKPQVHGYQSADKAERAAKRHDRLADKATSQWSKAEYWTSRTAGVISHALYSDLPAVRMTRIKGIEKDIRSLEGRVDERGQRWLTHSKLRLAYEKQMIEAQGGMAEELDIVAGGLFAGQLIHGVTKSPATKRVSSVKIMRVARYGVNKGQQVLASVKIERYGQDSYTPPTDETLAQLAKIKAEMKAAKKLEPKKPSLINPTLEDAQRLQDLLNIHKGEEQDVLQITMAEYKALSVGYHSRVETNLVCGGGKLYSNHWNTTSTEPICKIRTASGDREKSSWKHFPIARVVHLTDKPSKKLPESVWIDPAIEYLEECKANAKVIIDYACDCFLGEVTICPKLWHKAKVCGLVKQLSQSQKSLTDYGNEILKPLLKHECI